MSQERRWVLSPPPPDAYLHSLTGVPASIAHIAYNRGISNLDELRTFLSPENDTSADPLLFPSMSEAVLRIRSAIQNRELIGIHGDFDADGVTSSALLHHGLRKLGAETTTYIPHRTDEGHGISMKGLTTLNEQGVSLIITADCGVSSYDEVGTAQNMGMDVIITDHHTPPPVMPPALAIVDPKRSDSTYPFLYLAAVGVAYKLIQALREAIGKDEDESLLDLLALGTVADIAPLVGENRTLVKRGLEILNSTEKPGIRELASVAGLSLGSLGTESIYYALGPRINAPGRVAHAMTSYRLLCANSIEEARPLAQELELRNRERQKLSSEVTERAIEEVLDKQSDHPILMVGAEDFPPGVVGLAAGKLVEQFYRPAIVMSFDTDTTRASARSIQEFDIIAALRQCDDLFIRYGGHSQAAGFVIPNENLESLQQRLVEIASQELKGVDLRPSSKIDTLLPIKNIDKRLIKFLGLLEPCGFENPAPIFLARGAKVIDARQLGEEGQHLRLKLREGTILWDAIGFNLGNQPPKVHSSIDLVYRLKRDNRSPTGTLQLEVLDLNPVIG